MEVDLHNTKSDSYKAWKREADALQAIGRGTNKHIVETFAIFNHWKKEYFMFPWADGGNLMDFIRGRNNTDAYRDPLFVMDIITQLVGLASAIETIHRKKYRHGDLKPQNILVFTGETRVGVWKVADLGLAKLHNKATGDRKGPTTSLGRGTISYEPPETVTTTDSPRSRLYDIWSMGCIILQLVICLLYGDKAFNDLNASTRSAKDQSSYWQADWTQNSSQWKNPKVHNEVLKLIDKMEKEFGSGKESGAIGTNALIKLTRLVRTKLLVVQLPRKGNKSSPPGYRARADVLHSELKTIKEQLNKILSTKSHTSRPAPTSPANHQVRPQPRHTSSDPPATKSHTSLQLRPPKRRSSDQIPGSHVSQFP